jgi:hypothetical protein
MTLGLLMDIISRITKEKLKTKKTSSADTGIYVLWREAE